MVETITSNGSIIAEAVDATFYRHGDGVRLNRTGELVFMNRPVHLTAYWATRQPLEKLQVDNLSIPPKAVAITDEAVAPTLEALAMIYR